MKMIDPAILAGVTAALRVLYWPGILLLALGLAGLAEGWLYSARCRR